MKSDKRKKSSRENGKKGGRPPGLVLVVGDSGEISGETRRGGVPCRVSSVVAAYLGAGWWSVKNPEEPGREWVVSVGRAELAPGRFKGRHVPRGVDPAQVIAGARRGGKGPRVALPEFRTMTSPAGLAYFEGRHWRGEDRPGETVKAARAGWEKQGRAEWERAGWPIQREKGRPSREEALEVAGVVRLECGEAWGEIAAAWVRRGRVFPHIWGEGRDCWIAERKRREVAGFEV